MRPKRPVWKRRSPPRRRPDARATCNAPRRLRSAPGAHACRPNRSATHARRPRSALAAIVPVAFAAVPRRARFARHAAVRGSARRCRAGPPAQPPTLRPRRAMGMALARRPLARPVTSTATATPATGARRRSVCPTAARAERFAAPPTSQLRSAPAAREDARTRPAFRGPSTATGTRPTAVRGPGARPIAAAAGRSASLRTPLARRARRATADARTRRARPSTVMATCTSTATGTRPTAARATRLPMRRVDPAQIPAGVTSSARRRRSASTRAFTIRIRSILGLSGALMRRRHEAFGSRRVERKSGRGR
jgi:hypothetical protein